MKIGLQTFLKIVQETMPYLVWECRVLFKFWKFLDSNFVQINILRLVMFYYFNFLLKKEKWCFKY